MQIKGQERDFLYKGKYKTRKKRHKNESEVYKYITECV